MAASLSSPGEVASVMADADALPHVLAGGEGPTAPERTLRLPPLSLGRARPARVALRRLSADVAQSLTTISQRGIDCLITVDGAGVGQIGILAHDNDTGPPRAGCVPRWEDAPSGWRLSLSAGVSQTLRDHFDREALIDWSGARMRLLYRNAAALSWLAARLNIDGGMPLDDASARSLRSAALDDLMTRLALTGLGAPYVVHDRTIATGHRDAGGSAFSFVVLLQPLTDARTTILAALETDAFGVNLLASLLENRRERPSATARDPSSAAMAGDEENATADDVKRAHRDHALSMRTRLVLPPVLLPIVDVQRLSAGDIVLLGVPCLSSARGMQAIRDRDSDDIALPGFVAIDDVSCWRIVVAPARDKGREGWRVRLINQEFGVADEAMDDFNGGANRSEHGDGAAGQGGRSASGEGLGVGDAWTDRVPVRVTFELGAKTVPLAELQRWREGSILTFPVPLSFRPPHRVTERARLDAALSVESGYPGRGGAPVGERDAEDAAADVAYDKAQDAANAEAGKAAFEAGVDRASAPAYDPDGSAERAPYRTPPLHDVQDTEDGTEPDNRPAVLVRIRVNGAALGIGELVDIDGQLGVSVLRLFVTGAEDGSDTDDDDAIDGRDVTAHAVTEAGQ